MLNSNEVKSEHIANGAVTTPKIADEAVTAAKLDERSVTTEKLATNAVTGSKLADNAVTGSKIRDGTVRAEKIAPGAITTAKIGEAQVTGSRIADRAVDSDKLANSAVTTPKIADRSVTKSKLSFELPEPGEVERPITPPLTSAELGLGSVESDTIANGAVTNEKIAANAITAGKLASGSVGPSEIQSNAVGTDEIAAGAVTAEKLAPGAGGDRFTFLMPSVDALYLTDITADIPYTSFDLSSWVPANAKGVILQLGIFNQAFTSGRAFFRVRTNETQRDALGVGMAPGQNSMTANQGIVPLAVGTQSIEYALESVGGPWVATLTLYITVIGYIV